MKDTEIEFNVNDLLNAVEEVRDHVAGVRKVTMRTTEVKLPDTAPSISPGDIAEARRALNVSQPVFARLLNVPTVTAGRKDVASLRVQR